MLAIGGLMASQTIGDRTPADAAAACSGIGNNEPDAVATYQRSCSQPMGSCRPLNDGRWICESIDGGGGPAPAPTTTVRPTPTSAEPAPAPNPGDGVCSATGNTRQQATNNYNNKCSQKLVDCDPAPAGGHICASVWLDNGKLPGGAPGPQPTPAPDPGTGVCSATGNTLNNAKTSYRNKCSQKLVDCDPAPGGGHICASVKMDNGRLPGGSPAPSPTPTPKPTPVPNPGNGWVVRSELSDSFDGSFDDNKWTRGKTNIKGWRGRGILFDGRNVAQRGGSLFVGAGIQDGKTTGANVSSKFGYAVRGNGAIRITFDVKMSSKINSSQAVWTNTLKGDRAEVDLIEYHWKHGNVVHTNHHEKVVSGKGKATLNTGKNLVGNVTRLELLVDGKTNKVTVFANGKVVTSWPANQYADGRRSFIQFDTEDLYKNLPRPNRQNLQGKTPFDGMEILNVTTQTRGTVDITRIK